MVRGPSISRRIYDSFLSEPTTRPAVTVSEGLHDKASGRKYPTREMLHTAQEDWSRFAWPVGFMTLHQGITSSCTSCPPCGYVFCLDLPFHPTRLRQGSNFSGLLSQIATYDPQGGQEVQEAGKEGGPTCQKGSFGGSPGMCLTATSRAELDAARSAGRFPPARRLKGAIAFLRMRLRSLGKEG